MMFPAQTPETMAEALIATAEWIEKYSLQLGVWILPPTEIPRGVAWAVAVRPKHIGSDI